MNQGSHPEATTSGMLTDEWYASIFRYSPDAIVVMDIEGRVVDWSPQAEEMFGWTREEACGQQLASLIVPRQHRDAHWNGLQRYRETGHGPILNQRLELTAVNRQGREFPVEFSVTPARIGDRMLFCGFLRPNEMQGSRNRSRRRVVESRLFQQAASRWSTVDSFEAALQDCVDMMCSITGWPIGHALLPEGGGSEKLQSTGIWHLTSTQRFGKIREASRLQRFSRNEGWPGRIWAADEAIWSTDIGDDPRFSHSELTQIGIRGVFGFPIVVDGETVAVIEFLTTEEVAPDPQLLMQVGSLSTQLARTMEKHRWEEERMRLAAIVDSSYDAIIGKDAAGMIVSWNDGAGQVYGYSAEEAVGQSVALLLPYGLSDEEPEIREALRFGRRLTEFETERKRKDGRVVPVAVTVSPIRDSAGRVVGSSSIERDISDRLRREIELQHAKDQAEAANRTKGEFLANISHELRTPMNAIIGMIELSLGEKLSAVVTDYLETARDSAQTLLYLLNDLLDFSRMEAGRFELDDEPFQLREVVDGAMKTLSLRASEKGLELVGRIGPEVPDRLMGDGHRLRQILLNLVNNAIKFTEQGEVGLSVSIERFETQQAQLRFSIKDTGIGIAPRDQEKIFRPFTQLDASTTRQQTGTGLGLAICVELIRKMGGELTLASRPREGSTFSFELRFPVLDDRRQSGHLVPHLSGLPVLVVDDNESNRVILEETLSGWNMQPTVVGDGRRALEEFRRARQAGNGYPLIIVDALMPKLDGFSLIRKLNDEGLSDTAAVLMLSSADRQTFRDRCADLEIAAYLEKPISQSDMLDALMIALKSPHLDEEMMEHVHETPRSLDVLLAEDTPANQKVVQAILQKRGHNVHIAHNGREAIERHKQADYDVILMDVQMPTVDGLQATAAIRKMTDRAKSQIPIVAMTAHARREDRLRCMQAGMDAYIAKPIDAGRLLQLVETTRRRADRQRQHTVAGEEVPQEDKPVPHRSFHPDSEPLIDRNAALKRLGGSEQLFTDMIGYFLEDAPQLLEAAQQGIAGGDADEVMRAAHSLKGLAANFDARATIQAAQRLEELGRSGDLDPAAEALAQLQFEVGRLSAELESSLHE